MFFSSVHNQFRFKKGIGCTHAIFTVRKIVDQLVSSGNTANVCAVDLSIKAFWTIHKINEKEYSRINCAINRDLISECVEWNDCWCAEFGINFGVCQAPFCHHFLLLYI